MTEKRTSTRRPKLAEADKLNATLKLYLTRGEQTAVDTLAVDGAYASSSDVCRQALGLLIRTKHSELIPRLRKDLIAP